MAKSSIVAASKKFTVSEGNPAVAQFSMSAPLDAAAQVAVRLTGVGASKGRDYEVFRIPLTALTGRRSAVFLAW